MAGEPIPRAAADNGAALPRPAGLAEVTAPGAAVRAGSFEAGALRVPSSRSRLLVHGQVNAQRPARKDRKSPRFVAVPTS